MIDPLAVIAIDEDRQCLLRADGVEGFITEMYDSDGEDVESLSEASRIIIEWPDMFTEMIMQGIQFDTVH